MKNFNIKKWYIWLIIETLFVGSIMMVLSSQIGVLQPSSVLTFLDCEVAFIVILVSFIIGFGAGIYYNKCE